MSPEAEARNNTFGFFTYSEAEPGNLCRDRDRVTTCFLCPGRVRCWTALCHRALSRRSGREPDL